MINLAEKLQEQHDRDHGRKLNESASVTPKEVLAKTKFTSSDDNPDKYDYEFSDNAVLAIDANIAQDLCKSLKDAGFTCELKGSKVVIKNTNVNESTASLEGNEITIDGDIDKMYAKRISTYILNDIAKSQYLEPLKDKKITVSIKVG